MTPSSPSPTTRSTSKRWLWGLGGLVVVLAVVLVVVLVTRDDDSSSSSSTTTTSTTTTTQPATTTAPTTAVPATTLPLPPVTDDPQTYAEFLFVAWQNGNQTVAADVASADAVSQMFAQAYQPSVTWTLGPCDPAAGSLYCTWTGSDNAKITMTVRTLTGGLPIQVVMVERN